MVLRCFATWLASLRRQDSNAILLRCISPLMARSDVSLRRKCLAAIAVAHDPRPEVSTRGGVLIVRDFKEIDRLPIASGFSEIQNNSDLCQGLSARWAAQSPTRAIGILMPLWRRREQIKVQAIPGLIRQYGDVP